MINEEWNTASLRIFSTVLSSKEITEILSCPPTKEAEKGELMSPRNPKSQIREDSIWILDSGLADTESLENHINKLAVFIREKKNELILLKTKCSLDIFCGLSIIGTQGSFSLSSNIIKSLSDFPIDVVFDLYTEQNK
jgi:hypothetical protein